MRKIIILAIASLIISSVIASCSSTSKSGCPGANSQGRVKGKFRA